MACGITAREGGCKYPIHPRSVLDAEDFSAHMSQESEEQSHRLVNYFKARRVLEGCWTRTIDGYGEIALIFRPASISIYSDLMAYKFYLVLYIE